MVEKNISQDFRLKNVDETKNYFLEEIEQIELMSRKHKKVCATFNYIEHLIILVSTITGCISNFDFASFFGIPIGITSSAIRLNNCAVAAGIKKCISMIKKSKRNMINSIFSKI